MSFIFSFCGKRQLLLVIPFSFLSLGSFLHLLGFFFNACLPLRLNKGNAFNTPPSSSLPHAPPPVAPLCSIFFHSFLRLGQVFMMLSFRLLSLKMAFVEGQRNNSLTLKRKRKKQRYLALTRPMYGWGWILISHTIELCTSLDQHFARSLPSVKYE